ncbi:hypothetical protein [Pseudalkalibacillus hwajinpoensis]|uniref:hypothetical protein n=1 Tax=Guptibacillus hwajinpoensis TaxID=208199 RepID=UPI001CD27FAA|nr:hypothetical protein [Pseudalkalibacillus hwajinpoensis]MCA0990916.1 hypothetical protein [Pseudalkalibacillus hwajinpoensis]
MKRLVIANFLLIISLIYRITKPNLYLPAFSIEAENPVKLTFTTLTIDTGFVTGNNGLQLLNLVKSNLPSYFNRMRLNDFSLDFQEAVRLFP